jgi:hypothetical protein
VSFDKNFDNISPFPPKHSFLFLRNFFTTLLYPQMYPLAFQLFSFPHVSPSNPARAYPISIPATCCTHFVLLHFNSRLKIRDKQRLRSSWLCSFFIHSYLVALGLKCFPHHNFS